MKAPRRAPASARPAAPTAAGPHANARAVYEHVERYLVGACNEAALEDWRLAMARAIELGQPMDVFIRELSLLYRVEYGLPGKGRHGASASARRSGAASEEAR